MPTIQILFPKEIVSDEKFMVISQGDSVVQITRQQAESVRNAIDVKMRESKPDGLPKPPSIVVSYGEID